MSTKNWAFWALLSLVFVQTGCCRMCNRWCGHQQYTTPAYAPAPVAVQSPQACVPCCPVQCCPTGGGAAAAPVGTPPPPAQFQRTYSTYPPATVQQTGWQAGGASCCQP